MNKYIYRGGKRTAREQATISVEKAYCDDKFNVMLDVSSTAAAMDALEAVVRGYEQLLGVPAHHILNVLATVMTVPCGRVERLEEAE